MFSNKVVLNMVVDNALAAVSFYEKVFEAKKGDIYAFPDRQGENEANIIIGDIALRLMDANAKYDCCPPKKNETDSIWLQISVANADTTLEKAVANGSKMLQEVSEFMGVRNAIILDPFGYTWTINQTIKDISFEERYAIYKKMHAENQ